MKVSRVLHNLDLTHDMEVCESTTANGEPCRREVAKGLSHCFQHDPDQLDGRAVKFDSIKREAYLQALRDGHTKSTAARSVNMSRQGVWSYCERHPEFTGLISNAEMSAAGDVEASLYKSAVKGSVPAQIFYLKNRVRESWTNADHQEPPTETPELDTSALTHEELLLARDIAAKIHRVD
tara:strand:+ start:1422 stop:1961 length:540 start_codon:yes stop_codon:yes gene_type:complete